MANDIDYVFEKHPHVRGENQQAIAPKLKKSETPPRAWGKPGVKELLVSLVRNTPTCVGKTVDAGTCQSWCRKHPHVRGENSLRLAIDW